jgi:hypothetical protein
VSLRARRAWQSVVASEARQSQPFLMRLLRFARNDNFSYEVATLPLGARNDISSIAFILVQFISSVPKNIGDIYLE